MRKNGRYVQVESESELGRILDMIEDSPVYLETSKGVFCIVRQPLLSAENERDDFVYDPEVALAGINAAAGAWRDLDTEAMKEYIYRAREEGTRPDGIS